MGGTDVGVTSQRQHLTSLLVFSSSLTMTMTYWDPSTATVSDIYLGVDWESPSTREQLMGHLLMRSGQQYITRCFGFLQINVQLYIHFKNSCCITHYQLMIHRWCWAPSWPDLNYYVGLIQYESPQWISQCVLRFRRLLKTKLRGLKLCSHARKHFLFLLPNLYSASEEWDEPCPSN